MAKQMLGKMFVDHKILTDEQLKYALTEASKDQLKLGQFLVKNSIVEGDILIDMLCKQLKVEKFRADEYPLDESLAGVIPFEIAQKHHVVPLNRCGRIIKLAMVDPMDIVALDSVENLIDEEVEPVICTDNEISQLINDMYSTRSRISDVLEDRDSETKITHDKKEEKVDDEDIQITEEMADEPIVVRLVNRILDQAVREGASDIHISPLKDLVQLSFRLDGKLHDMQELPKNLFHSIIARLKILSKMDITLTRVPQDGRFTLKVQDKEINVRTSCVPLIHGENMVLRILDMDAPIYSLDLLGMSANEEHIMRDMINKPHGMILSAGPAGSGKSTSLYAMLNEINKPDINIITLEDPVEYRSDHIRQIQLNVKAGMTFANGLKSVLRQDPDVIMVGEIRDRETANIAVQAALTGHRVFSTVHTNDSASAVTRLIDMGIEFFLISSVLLVTFSQRLVRVICEHCKEPYRPPKEILVACGIDKGEDLNFQRGKGCSKCMNSGYKGRTPIFEILVNDEMVKKMILQKKSPLEITNEAVAAGKLITLKDAAIKKVISGVTTVEEIASVVMF